MISHWEEFQSGPTQPLDKRMNVTLSPKNIFYLNGNICDKLGNPEAVRLLFDKVNSLVGIDPAPASLPNAFPLKSRLGTKSRQIIATTFCRHYGIKVDSTTAFLRLDLKTTTRVSRPGARRHSR